jgi:hypothetical protein
MTLCGTSNVGGKGNCCRSVVVVISEVKVVNVKRLETRWYQELGQFGRGGDGGGGGGEKERKGRGRKMREGGKKRPGN